MKRLLLCTAIIIFGSLSVSAQEIQYGVKAGVGFTSLKVKNQLFSITNTDTGFYLGGFADIEISDVLSLKPEFLYVSIKDLNHVSIPVMAKYGVSEEFNVLAGPSFGYFLDADEGFESINYGLEIGASYDIIEALFVEARYNFGLANLLENTSTGVTRKLSSFFVGLGYKL